MNLPARLPKHFPLHLTSLLLLASACCPAAAPPAPPKDCSAVASGAKPADAPKADRLIQDFDNASVNPGHYWYEFDKNPLGTVANPNPFKLADEGSPKSPGHSAHIWGTLGASRAPWSWVQLQLFLNGPKKAEDISGYKNVSFYAKGDGGRYQVAIVRDAVKDFDQFHYEFTAPREWTLIQIPIEAFKQAGWGKAIQGPATDVKFINISPATPEQPFDIFIDDVTLSTETVVIKPFAYDTTGWFPYKGFDPGKRKGTALDVSQWIEAPAGKHGPLGKKGEKFVFRDGKEARFFGVNIVASANFPTHEEADKLALGLSQMGVNLTRHHHMDAAWSNPNFFGNRASTLELDAAAMERFDYLVSALQKRGIYQFFDMLVHRKVVAADGVPGADKLAAGLKIEGEFEPKLIELQEKFITQLLSHKNSHTGLTYGKDPSLVMMEAINEDSLFWMQPEGEFSVKTPEGNAELNKQFAAWLAKAGIKDRATLEKRWAGSGKVLDADEDPAKATVKAFIATGKQAEKDLSPARAKDTLSFLYDTELGFYKRIEKVVRGQGYQGLFTGSNHWTEHPLDFLANSKLDFTDRHAYWSHPNGGWGYKPEVTWENHPMVKDLELGNVGRLSRQRVKGMPYSTSEWQNSAPNDYRHEGLFILGAYAAYQGFSPIQFAVSHDVNNKIDSIDMLSSNFDIIQQPTMLGGWPAVSAMFHRGDVRPADVEGYLKLNEADGLLPAATFNAPKQLALIARTGIGFGAGQTKAELEALRAKHVQGTRVTSTTGQLRHDATVGRFELDTERTQGIVSFASESPVALSQTKIELKSPFGVIIVSSLTKDPIATSKHLLVTALGNAVNTGMQLTNNKTGFVNVGTGPILVEPILGKVTLLKSTGTAHCFPLDASGQRKAEIPVESKDGALTLDLTAAHQTMHYEITR